MPCRVGRLAALALASCVALCLLISAGNCEPSRVVVFVAPSGVDLDAPLRDALTAQLSGGGTEMVFEKFSADATTLRKQVTEARALSSKYSSLGVFWLEAPLDKDWLLYLAEPAGDRVLVRRITVEADGAAAATEAVAVITSESTEALAHGQKLGMEPVPLPPEPLVAAKEPSPFAPPPPPPRKPPAPTPTRPHGFVVSLAYAGDAPAREVSWQSGGHVGLAYRWPIGLYAGIGYAFFGETNVTSPSLSFHVSRSPLDAVLGAALSKRGFRPAAEIRTVVELLTRQNVATASSYEATPTTTRPLVYLGPRLRLEQDVARAFSLYVAGGIDFALNPFSFVSRVDNEDRALLRPALIRPAIEVGALLWP